MLMLAWLLHCIARETISFIQEVRVFVPSIITIRQLYLIFTFVDCCTSGVDRTIRCWRLDNGIAAESANTPDIDQSDAVDNLDEVFDEMKIEAPIVSKNKKKKDKKRNKRFASNNYKLQFSLIWDEDHVSKINVLSSFYPVDRNLPLEKIFVGDVSDNLTIYTL